MPVTFPDGSVLNSTALTPDTLGIVLQKLAAQMIGLLPSNSATDPAYSSVRLDWPTQGQPAWAISEDICFLRIAEDDDDYNRVRDLKQVPRDSASLTSTWTYTRVWGVDFTLYGPSCADRARAIKDALFLDWTEDTLASNNLSLVTDCPAPRYLPELFAGQWWKRADLHIQLNELVTSTTTVSSIASAEVLLDTERGIVADVTAHTH